MMDINEWSWANQNCHYVPQFMLKRFRMTGQNRQFLLEYDKTTKAFACRKPKAAASQYGYYTKEGESILTSAEQPASNVIEKIQSGKRFTPKDLSAIPPFVFQMMVRGPAARERLVNEFFPQDMDKIRQSLARQGIILSPEHWRAIEEGYPKDPVFICEVGESVVPQLLGWMYCRIYRTKPSKPFITCDNPCMLLPPTSGLRHDKVEVLLPISKTHVIHYSWKPLESECTIHADESQVDAVNKAVAYYATRYLYGSDREAITKAVKSLG